MNVHTTQRGQSLIEVVFAITIFTIGVVTIGYVLLDSLVSLEYATESTQARLLASEGIEAVRSIRDSGFDTIPAGTYGLFVDGGLWTLVSAPDVMEKFQRTIVIDDIDKDTKNITVRVAWSMFERSEKSISYTTRLTNWMQTGNERGMLAVSTVNATLFASSTELAGLSFENTGDTDISITRMTITWNSEALLTEIVMGGIEVFGASTSAPVSAGADIDISDYSIPAYTGFHPIDMIRFDRSVENLNFTIAFTLDDGSTRYVYISP